jgi:hypothetical protein
VPWVGLPIEVECFGGPCDGQAISVPQHLAIAGGHVRAPVGNGAEDYVLARDDDGSWRCIAAQSN